MKTNKAGPGAINFLETKIQEFGEELARLKQIEEDHVELERVAKAIEQQLDENGILTTYVTIYHRINDKTIEIKKLYTFLLFFSLKLLRFSSDTHRK